MGNKHITLDESKPKSLFIDRNSSYAVNCKTGYQGNYHNAHHAVPCTSIQKSLKTYLDKKPPEYNKALARFTKWDVNSEPNLVGLPHRHAYELAYKQVLSAILDLLDRNGRWQPLPSLAQSSTPFTCPPAGDTLLTISLWRRNWT